MHPLPPEALPAVPHVFFTLLGIPFTLAWPNLVAWVIVVVVFVAGAFARLPRFVEGGE